MSGIQRISISQAILCGLIVVNGPILPIVIGVPWLTYTVVRQLHGAQFLTVASAILGFMLAWVWWSITVPQWRLWAMHRVGDLGLLHRYAVQIGIEWPRNHVFERTEIKSPQHRLEEARLWLHYCLTTFLDDSERLNRDTSDDYSAIALRRAVQDCLSHITQQVATSPHQIIMIVDATIGVIEHAPHTETVANWQAIMKAIANALRQYRYALRKNSG